MDSVYPGMYKEVALLQHSILKNKRKLINVSCGGYPTMLVDLKIAELSGGIHLVDSSSGRSHTFIHWRTLRETLYLSEICLHRNDICNEVKIRFNESPILSVKIQHDRNSVYFILITTTTSFLRIPIQCPLNDGLSTRGEMVSMLLKLDEKIIMDPMNCYIFITDIGHSLPEAAEAIHCPDSSMTKFAIGTAHSLYLFSMGFGGITSDVQVKELNYSSSAILNILDTIANSWRRKVATQPSQVAAMCFSTAVGGEPLLFTLHRDSILRVWMHSGRLLVVDHLSKYTDGNDSELHSCELRGSTSKVVLFLSFQTSSKFVILQPTVSVDASDGSISSLVLQNVCTISAPNCDLIDFKLCDHSLWTIWYNSEGEIKTLAYDIGKQVWISVIMENTLYKVQPTSDSDTDLREFYCNRIFLSDLFPCKAIRKALMTLQLSSSPKSSIKKSTVRLKQEVLNCIERQFLQQQQEAMLESGPLDNEQLVKLSNDLWEKFYLCCAQHTIDSFRPVGLFLSENQLKGKRWLTVGTVRKMFVSFFRPSDRIEVALHAKSDETPVNAKVTLAIAPSLQKLVDYLKEVEQTLTQKQKIEMNNYIHQRRGSDSMLDQLSPLEATRNQSQINMCIAMFTKPRAAIELMRAIQLLLDWMKPANPLVPCKMPVLEEEEIERVSVNTGEELAGELAVVTAKQILELRYTALRNLLLVQYLAIKHRKVIACEELNKIESNLLPTTKSLLRCYHVMNWAAQTRLDLGSTKMSDLASAFASNMRTSMTILQAYAISALNVDRLKGLHSGYGGSTDGSEHIDSSLELSLIKKAHVLISYLCPLVDDFRFGEWLSINNLHIQIDEYTRLLHGWCKVNIHSYNYIKAKSHLIVGETGKAVDLFPRAIEGIQHESYLQKILMQEDKLEHNFPPTIYDLPSKYYLHVIQLFELYGAYDGVLALVGKAIDSTIQVSQKAIFQNIEFNSHIACGHFKDAIVALSKNYDPERQKDCLRQLVFYLLSKRRLDILVNLPYCNLEKEFTYITARIARSSDIEDSKAGGFLCAFYIENSKMRDAAATAYEEALRHYANCSSQAHLEKYYSGLLTTLSCLAAVPDKPRAWIRNMATRKILPRGNQIPFAIDVNELNAQLLVASYALKLSQGSRGFKLVKSLEPTEVVALLMHRKMYNHAFQLARCCVRSMVPAIYEHLSSSCISATGDGAGEPPVPISSGTSPTNLAWLHENCVADVTVGADSASTAWNYLQYMLQQEPAEHATEAYLAVLNRIIARGAQLPTWLEVWCFKHAPAQLVRIHLCYGRLEEAIHYMLELFPVSKQQDHVNFPLKVFEHLIYEMEQSSNYTENMEQIERYLNSMDAGMHPFSLDTIE